MTARIVLVRHGQSSHGRFGGAIDRAGVEAWRAAYDAAGIHDASHPPPELLQLAVDATHIIASDLRRAVVSAERLAPRRSVQVSGLLREMPLAIPRWPTRLPMAAWEALIHLNWSYQMLRRIDAPPADAARAAAASQWLAEVAHDGSIALVVTHGVFRRLVAKELINLGWISTGRRGGYNHWSAWSFAARAGGGRSESIDRVRAVGRG